MITIQSGKLSIPEDERSIGFAGDDQTTEKQFIVPDCTDTESIYTLYLRFDDGRVSSAPLTPTQQGADVVLTWSVRVQHLLKPGIVMAQVKITDSGSGVMHTSWDYFITGISAELNDEGAEIDILSRTEFEERTLQAVAEARAIAPFIGDDGYWYVYNSVQGGYIRSVSAYGIPVDSQVSGTSTNPVQNRAIKQYTDNALISKADKATTLAGYGITDAYTKAQVNSLIPTVPTKTSDLVNDSGFLTQHQDISGKADISDVPTKTSDLTNDSGFLTQHQDVSGKMDRPLTSLAGDDTSGVALEQIFKYSNEYYIKGSGATPVGAQFKIENARYKVTSLDSDSTDSEYPSAKCVYDMIGDVESVLASLL